jgi:phage tail sheath protein FI
MPEYLSPGVYVEEVDRGAKSIEGASTSTAGFLGQTERGPTKPQLLTSFADYKRQFGGFIDESYLAYGVDGFFRNGGSRCFVGRITAEDPNHAARCTLADGDGSDVVGATAIGPGAWGTTIAVIVEDGTMYKEGENELFKVTVRYWSVDPDQISDADGDAPEPSPDVAEVYDDLSPDQSSSNYHEKRISGVSNLISVERLGDGRPDNGTTWLELDGDVSTDGGNNGDSDVGAGDEDTGSDGSSEIPDDDELGEMTKDELTEIGDSLDLDTSQNKADLLESLKEHRDTRTDGGVELTLGDYEGVTTPGERTGLAAFTEIPEISIVCVPDENDVPGLTDSIVTHCANMSERFAILQAPQSAGSVPDMEPPVDSTYAAYYYPWIHIIDPDTGIDKLVPPGGHITGIYARSDGQVGVHKAPANEVIRGAQELQLTLTKGEQDILNPKGVNCTRSFSGRGIRVWGARTTSSDPSWKYINVRRLFLFVEQSIYDGTQWVVFEPNDEDLWARVTQTVENFLTTVWRSGALMGTTASEAFFVRCDRSTMTQDDIDNGRLIVEIGISPVKPAEFVIFRIGQMTADGGE